VLVLGLAVAGDTAGGEARIATDADIIAAIDTSSSITNADLALEYAGLARALREPRFLAQVAGGPQGRVGFAAFTWSSEDRFDVIVPWMIISTEDDARRAALALVAASPGKRAREYEVARTDIGLAIRVAMVLAHSSPYAAPHRFINICANGIANAGEPPSRARDRALRESVTIDAVIFGSTAVLTDYFQRNVVGGPGAFILPIRDAQEMATFLVRKFWLDLTS
jgi:Protein of unknown function (DUF1194)